MPIYEYQCDACGHQLETMQKFSEAPLTTCPTCHKESLKKLISNTSFQLKGTGWYVTDTRDKGKPKPATTTESTETKATTENTESSKSTDTSTGSTDKAAGST